MHAGTSVSNCARTSTSIVSHRYAQIGREKSRDVVVDWAGRAAIMAWRDRWVRDTQIAFERRLHKTVRTPCLIVYSAGAYANKLDLSAPPKRLLVAAVIPVCQADISSQAWGRFGTPFGGVITCFLSAHFGFAPLADSGARFAARGGFGSARASNLVSRVRVRLHPGVGFGQGQVWSEKS